MAQVDCYLTSGCEISIDVDNALLKELVDVQHMFLRSLVGLNSHSMLAVLFMETGQMLIRIHRLILALGRLQYMLSVNQDRVVHLALLDSVAQFCQGQLDWALDLSIMLLRLPQPIQQLVVVTRCLCHYLTMVAVPAHRKALTRLLLGDHNLSVEHLQYPVRYRLPVP
ncbi:hypothetical protein B0H10DRAFT_2316634 [Mycena sp. CBHHK59/15]|nr:hypothetical protein B0H10DRAFT_2316634 [Mycena sp. CBHHK59/15]